MELINNISKTLRDDLMQQIKAGSRLSIAASCFSIYAFEEQTQLCVFHTRLQQSDWHETESTEIPLTGLTLDDVWENIVAAIGGLDTQSEESIEEQIIHREQREQLLRQIETLEKRSRVEKQTRKKYELHQLIMKLKEQLE
jgi:hypothetical protein